MKKCSSNEGGNAKYDFFYSVHKLKHGLAVDAIRITSTKIMLLTKLKNLIVRNVVFFTVCPVKLCLLLIVYKYEVDDGMCLRSTPHGRLSF